eukprot:4092680-Pleurochrysis_carterae.AAC.1
MRATRALSNARHARSLICAPRAPDSTRRSGVTESITENPSRFVKSRSESERTEGSCARGRFGEVPLGLSGYCVVGSGL